MSIQIDKSLDFFKNKIFKENFGYIKENEKTLENLIKIDKKDSKINKQIDALKKRIKMLKSSNLKTVTNLKDEYIKKLNNLLQNDGDILSIWESIN